VRENENKKEKKDNETKEKKRSPFDHSSCEPKKEL
jgi:hypothetical protein